MLSTRALPVHATCTDEETQIDEQTTSAGYWDLLPFEIRWRDRQLFLENLGYRLRPRYRPGWKPSWLGTNIDPQYCEDAIPLLVSAGTTRHI